MHVDLEGEMLLRILHLDGVEGVEPSLGRCGLSRSASHPMDSEDPVRWARQRQVCRLDVVPATSTTTSEEAAALSSIAALEHVRGSCESLK